MSDLSDREAGERMYVKVNKVSINSMFTILDRGDFSKMARMTSHTLKVTKISVGKVKTIGILSMGRPQLFRRLVRFLHRGSPVMVDDFSELIFIFQIAVGTIYVEGVCVSEQCKANADICNMYVNNMHKKCLNM